MITLAIYAVISVVAFGIGVLFGRRNVAKVEKTLAEVKAAALAKGIKL
jgi:hypothetical protein